MFLHGCFLHLAQAENDFVNRERKKCTFALSKYSGQYGRI